MVMHLVLATPGATWESRLEEVNEEHGGPRRAGIRGVRYGNKRRPGSRRRRTARTRMGGEGEGAGIQRWAAKSVGLVPFP